MPCQKQIVNFSYIFSYKKIALKSDDDTVDAVGNKDNSNLSCLDFIAPIKRLAYFPGGFAKRTVVFHVSLPYCFEISYFLELCFNQIRK